MNNDFGIFCKTKTCRVLIIDIYDPANMERPREERFGELKSLLTHDKVENLTIRKLTYKNPTMKEKFDEAREVKNDTE